MDLANALQGKNFPVENEQEIKPDKKIIEEILTKGRYEETVKLKNFDITVTFQTRLSKEDLIVREEFSKDVPQLVQDFYFKLALYNLCFSLKELNGKEFFPPNVQEFKDRLNFILERIPSPLLSAIIKTFFEFEKKVAVAVDPDFLQEQ